MQILFPKHNSWTVTVADIFIEEEANEHWDEELVPIPNCMARLSFP